ncbi:hypothetical protein JCM1393_25200 [Clostridium carnis]
MNIEEDLKICKEILQQYKKLTTEDGEGAFKLSQLSIAMYDRLNEIRLQVNTLEVKERHTKSDIKEFLRSKMKVMEYIHVESRAIFNAVNNDKKFKRE